MMATELQRHPAPGVIELMNRSGQVLQRIPYNGGGLSVGRAYDNDIIVSDPYVCPHHLQISEEDGELIARDLDSVNGTYAGRRRNRVAEAQLEDGALIFFGHSQLRFRNTAAAVAPAWRDTARHGVLAWFGKAWMLMFSIGLAVLVIIADSLLDSAEELGAGVLASQLLYPAIGIFIWAGFWALLNRVISHRANFHVHLAIACLGLGGLFLTSQMISLASFAFGWDTLLPWLRVAGRILVLSLLVYAHLRYATHGRTWVQAAVAVMTGALLFGTPAVGDVLDRQEFSSLPYLSPVLKPPVLQLRSGISVEAFFERAQALKTKTDAAATD